MVKALPVLTIIVVLLIGSIGVCNAATMTLYANNSSATSSTAFSFRYDHDNTSFPSLIGQMSATSIAYNEVAASLMAQNKDIADNYTTLRRGVLIFPTEELPDGITITSTKIGVKAHQKYNDLSLNVIITKFVPSGAANSLDNFNNFENVLFTTPLPISTIITTDYTIFTLNSYGRNTVSTTSPTMFGVRLENDVSGVSPIWEHYAYEYVEFNNYSVGGTPYLEIEYTIPTPVSRNVANVESGISITSILMTLLPIVLAGAMLLGLIAVASGGDLDPEMLAKGVVAIGIVIVTLYIVFIISGSLSKVGALL